MMAGIAIAYLAGVLAAFNPCGFALLPGYLALFLDGLHDRRLNLRLLQVLARRQRLRLGRLGVEVVVEIDLPQPLLRGIAEDGAAHREALHHRHARHGRAGEGVLEGDGEGRLRLGGLRFTACDCGEGRSPTWELRAPLPTPEERAETKVMDGLRYVRHRHDLLLPMITIAVGGAHGPAGQVLGGRSMRPRFLFSWPNARAAMMPPARSPRLGKAARALSPAPILAG